MQGVRAPALAAAAAAHFASPHAAPLLGRSPYNVRLLELLAFVDAAARVRGDVPLLGPELAAAAAAAAAAVAARPRALSLAQTELVAAVAAALPPGVSHAVAVSPLPGIQVLVHLAGAGGAVDMDGPSRCVCARRWARRGAVCVVFCARTFVLIVFHTCHKYNFWGLLACLLAGWLVGLCACRRARKVRDRHACGADARAPPGSSRTRSAARARTCAWA